MCEREKKKKNEVMVINGGKVVEQGREKQRERERGREKGEIKKGKRERWGGEIKKGEEREGRKGDCVCLM